MALTTEPLLKTKRDCSHPVSDKAIVSQSPDERQGITMDRAFEQQEREERGLLIAATSKLQKAGDDLYLEPQ